MRWLPIAATALLLCGCGSAEDAAPAGDTAGVEVTVVIASGNVSPTNERVDAVVRQPITVTVDSDIEDELHVHSVPDHSFEIVAESGQVFEFTVDVPGQVDLELHDLGKTVATVLVRP